MFASAIVALCAFPAVVSHAGTQAVPTPAPLLDDAAIRARTIAFEESRVRLDAQDQITPRMLAAQYLQRYRETGDVGDVLRAEAQARRSLRAQPHGNVAALQALADAQLTLHRFRDALATVRSARRLASSDPSLAMSEASLDLELGDVDSARRLVERVGRDSESTETIGARVAELTGDLPRARTLLTRALVRTDAMYGVPNERRAWFFARRGELAFEAGDASAAIADERTALERFPNDLIALTDAARFSEAAGAWTDARAFARHAVDVTPSPENLGLLADADDRLGDARDAAATRDEIVAVERVGNAQHLVDRLLALYDADHRIRLDDAVAIAVRDRGVRDDVFTEDTLAWAAARAGRWNLARRAASKAIAWHTADPRIWYHAAVIAQHDGRRADALRDYEHALALNPAFAPVFADDARAQLARLGG